MGITSFLRYCLSNCVPAPTADHQPLKMDSSQVAKAVEALLDYKEKKAAQQTKSSLIENADPISVQFAFKSIPERGNKKAILLDLPHPLYAGSDAKVCLICKDPQRKVKDMLEGQPAATNVDKVLGLSKLRKRYKQYDDKKQLCSSYDVFLADDSVAPMLPPLTGKVFFASKRMPIPIDMRTKTKLLSAITKARNSTAFHHGAGACSAVKVATTEFEQEEIVANIMSVVDSVAEATPRKWKNIRSIHIKTHDSIALPVFDSESGTKRAAEGDAEGEGSVKKKKPRRKKAQK